MKKKDPRNVVIYLDPQKEDDRAFEDELLWYQGHVVNTGRSPLGRGPAVREAARLFIRGLQAQHAKSATGG